MKAPERIYCECDGIDNIVKAHNIKWPDDEAENIEYIRADAFIQKALKWYCLDCECNDKCKDTKCFFHNAYKRYLEGDTNCLPPKFSDTILNEDGSTSNNWHYRHFTAKIQDAFIQKAATWIASRYQANGSYLNADDIDDFEKYMKGE